MFFKSHWNETTRENYCKDKFGVVPDTDWLQTRYGDMSAVSRVIFSNGGLDPWGKGGILKSDESREVYSLQIPSGAHHLDLREKHENDPEDVIAVRKIEDEIISRWLEG